MAEFVNSSAFMLACWSTAKSPKTQIFVKTLTGKTITSDVEASDTKTITLGVEASDTMANRLCRTIGTHRSILVPSQKHLVLDWNITVPLQLIGGVRWPSSFVGGMVWWVAVVVVWRFGWLVVVLVVEAGGAQFIVWSLSLRGG